MRLRGDTVKLGLQFRTATISPPAENWRELEAAGERQDTIELSFSSETPVERYFGWETLGHKRSEVVLDRIRDGGAFLKDHNTRQQIGVHEKVWVDTDSRKGRALVRFGRTALAEEERVEVLDRVRTKISTGYIVHEMTLVKSDESGDHYRVTRWEPVENSTVAIPADLAVGVGRELEVFPGLAARAAEFANHETRVIRATPEEDHTMKRIFVTDLRTGAVSRIAETDFNSEVHERFDFEPTPPPPPTPAPTPAPRAEPSESEADRMARAELVAAETERKRIRNLETLAAKFNARDLLAAAIDDGTTYEQFRFQIWEEGRTRNGDPTGERHYPSIEDPAGWLGLTPRELSGYSLLRAIRAHVNHTPEAAGRELEMSREIATKIGREPQGFFVPRDLLAVPIPHANDPVVRERFAQHLRAISSTTQGGGSLIATDLMAGAFIDVLRALSVTMSMGATFLPGLVGDLDIPRQATASVGTWMAEAGTVTASELSLDLVQLTPHTLGSKQVITRKMLLQSTPAIEGLVRADMALAMALGIDKAAIQGAGTGAIPEGILNMSGVTVVPIGANGGPMTWAVQVALQTEVEASDAAMGALGFVTSPAAKGHMLATAKETGYPVYILQEPGNASLGHRVLSSNQVPTNLTKGTGTNLTAEIFGDWTSLLIGEWGVMDLFPDPYSLGDNAMLTMRVFQDADVAARHEESFAICVDIDTA